MDNTNDIKPFVIQNAGNTCYIDSLLVGLFYTKSPTQFLLTNDIRSNAIYLQEYINVIVNKIRNNTSILAEDMSMLRTLLIDNGWKTDQYEEYVAQQDVSEFYTFLINILEGPSVEIQRKTIAEGLGDSTAVDVGVVEKVPFIPLSIPDQASTSIKEMLNSWMFDNFAKVSRDTYTEKGEGIKQDVQSLITYTIDNDPYILALSINRFKDGLHKDLTPVEIQTRLSPQQHRNKIYRTKWTFSAVICHRGSSSKLGHYYTLFLNGDRWFLFDDLLIPSVVEVSMSDPKVTQMIKTESVFVLYRTMG